MRYRTYANYLKDKYGEKVYKLPVSVATTCPNRDGTKGTGGCIFCGEKGTGFENHAQTLSVTEQLQKNIEHIGKKNGGQKYIAYFQTFTNTYIEEALFESYCREAAAIDTIAELHFSTRPDCLNGRHLEILSQISKETGKEICIELGLQSINNSTLERVNRCHTVEDFLDAVEKIKRYGFQVCVHMILNFPWDEEADAVKAAKMLSALSIDHVKLHSLYIEKDTTLCDLYEQGQIEIISVNEYIKRTIAFLEYLDPSISLQRLLSRIPEQDMVFSNWSTSWWKIKHWIEKEMEKKDLWQGDLL